MTKPKKKPQDLKTITAYVSNVKAVDPTVESVTVSYSGKAFYKLIKAMLLAKAARNLYLIEGCEDLARQVSLECSDMLQAAVDDMAEEANK